MTNRLLPCPGCTRHVRASESACPFCGESLGDALASAPPLRAPTTRLGRAATFAFGAAVATTLSVTGCAESEERAPDGGAQVDSGGPVPAYGAPAIDSGTPAIDSGTEQDAGAVGPLYGGPTPVDAGSAPDAGGGAVPAYGAPPDPSS
ncbi:hypothetical protein [Sandaracinus amylolyticus]|uniref:hypothetical protein n=1 Tax=Sandaracinus amylolyticus TaxID=927083 RepID=UPI001F1AE6C2|nr:hypothetical protein [Sandaracinus amylolyticus]UJR82379.1 Hypothetical protein I5071_44440 [Sandaracinus amylolyticus]